MTTATITFDARATAGTIAVEASDRVAADVRLVSMSAEHFRVLDEVAIPQLLRSDKDAAVTLMALALGFRFAPTRQEAPVLALVPEGGDDA